MTRLLTTSVRAIRRTWGTVTDAWRFGSKPPAGRVTLPSRQQDMYLTAVSDQLNLTKLRALISAADDGDLASGMKLIEEMQQKDIHLVGVVETRQDTLTGLEWEVVSAADVMDAAGDRELADKAATYVGERFNKIEQFEEALEHLATAACSNLAVAELVWEEMQLADVVPVDSWRLRMDDTEPGLVRVLTEEDMVVGVAATAPKFVVHIPKAPKMLPYRRSALRAQAVIYLVKQLALVDWATFCEVFGMPIRWATYRAGASAEEKAELVDMMENLGTKAYGVFSEAVQLDIKESSQRGTAPFQALIDWCDRKQSILFLRGNLGTDTTGGTGTHAAAAVQDDVREDVLNADIRREARTIRRQIIAPMCAFHFSGYDVPLPQFQRRKPEVVDRSMEADVFIKAQQAGVPIPKAFAHKRLAIPEPQEGEEVLTPSLDTFGEGMSEGSGIGD